MFLEISENSREKTCARVSFLITLQASGLRPETLFKKRLWHGCFPVNCAEFLRTSFFQSASERLLLWKYIIEGTLYREPYKIYLFCVNLLWRFTKNLQQDFFSRSNIKAILNFFSYEKRDLISAWKYASHCPILKKYFILDV